MSIFGGGSNDGLGGLGGLGGSGQTSGTPSVESIMEQAAKTELSKNLSTSLGAFILGQVFFLYPLCKCTRTYPISYLPPSRCPPVESNDVTDS